MDYKETFNKIKSLFDGMPPVAPAPASAPADNPSPTDSASVAYAVEGGSPVYVNISDDGVADIDQNDAVFSDEGLTIPYPDGTYKVAGSDFSFTVANGVVSAVMDPDGTGPGQAMDSEDMAKKFAAHLEKFNQFETAFTSYKTEFESMKGEFASAKETIQKLQMASQEMLSIIEKLASVPVANPITAPTNFKSDKVEKREDRLERISLAARSLKENN